MPQIIIIRHAKSDWSSFNSDFERGLNERGYKSCEIISLELKKRINFPDKFLVSPAKRAQLTFEEIFFSWPQNKSIYQLTSSEEILYGGSKVDILNLIKQNFSGIQTGILIGHNPVVSELINDMAFKNKKLLPDNLVTAGCVIFDYESSDYVNSNFKDGIVKEYIFPRQFI